MFGLVNEPAAVSAGGAGTLREEIGQHFLIKERPHMKSSESTLRHGIRRLVGGLEATRSRLHERREHDFVMTDPAMAQEHQAQIGKSLARGEGGCTFCR